MGWREKAVTRKSTAAKTAKWLHIESVKPLNVYSDVWCLTVPGVEEFSLGNGAIVHNSSHGSSAFRTLALSWQPPKGYKPGERPGALQEGLLRNSITGQTFGESVRNHLRKAKASRSLRI